MWEIKIVFNSEQYAFASQNGFQAGQIPFLHHHSDPPLVSSEYLGFFFSGIKRPRGEANHSTASSTQPTGAWSYTFTSQHVWI
jgi:hypothetical protein